MRRWHLLDNGAQLARRGLTPAGTLLCVHGNPTWSYLWRTLLAAGSDPAHPWRVVAVDQLDMGFSERTGTFRRLADRINDLGDLTAALGLDGPVVTVGHDWGGVISLGWALAHPQQLAGVVLTNTAVHQPSGSPIPPALRLALHPAVHRWGTTTSDTFLRVTHSLAHPPLAADVRSAFMAPYRRRRPPRRRGELCRRHSCRRVPSQLPGAQPRRRRAARAERSGPDALGPAGPDLFRPVPQGPHRPAAARESAPLRGRRPPGRRRPGHRRPRLRVAGRARPGQRSAGQRTAAGRRPARRTRRHRARHRDPAPLGAAHRAGGRTRRRGHRRRGNGRGRQRRPLAQLAGAGTEHRRPRGGPAGSRCRARQPGEPDGSAGRGPDRGPLRLPAARRGGGRGRRRPGHPRPEPRGEGRHPGFPHRNRQGPGGRLGARLAGTAHQCAGPAGRPPPRSSASKPPSPPSPAAEPARPGPAAGRQAPDPDAPRRRALHLRLHRSRQGRALHAPAAGRDAGYRGRDAGDPPGRTPGGGLRAVRPAGTGARSSLGDARHGRHRAPHADGPRAGGRRRGHRRHGGLRLARGAAQRPRDPGQPEPGRARGAGARGAAALRRRARPRIPPRRGAAAAAPGLAAHPVRDDRGAARHGHQPRTDPRRRGRRRRGNRGGGRQRRVRGPAGARRPRGRHPARRGRHRTREPTPSRRRE